MNVRGFLLCAILLHQAPWIAATPNGGLKDDVLSEAFRGWRRISRWSIEYRAIPSEHASNRLQVHEFMAVASPSRFYHFAAHESLGAAWHEDPFAQELYINDGRFVHCWPFNRSYSEGNIKLGSNIPGTVWKDVLLAVIPAFPLPAYRLQLHPKLQTPIILRAALERSDYHLLSYPEEMRGIRSWVFECKGREKIWINKEHGYLIQREAYDPATGTLMARVITDWAREVAPGVWLPLEFHFQIFRKIPGGDGVLLERENRVLIVDARFNDQVSDNQFIPVLRAGMLKSQSDGELVQVRDGGEDLLDDVIKYLKQNRSEPVSRPQSWNVRFVALTISLGCILYLLGWRNPRRKGLSF